MRDKKAPESYHMDRESKLDAFRFFCLCVLLFSAPFSSALVEWMAGLAVLASLIKWFVVMPSHVRCDKFSKQFFLSYADLGLWMGLSILSVVFGDYLFLGVKGFLGKTLQNVFLFAIASELCQSPARRKTFVQVLATSMFLICLSGIGQYVFGTDFIRGSALKDHHGRVSSTLRAPNDFGAYLVLFGPVFFALLLSSSESIKEFFPKKMKNVIAKQHVKKLLLGLFIMVLTCLGLTFSRGTWLAMLVALSMVTLVSSPRMFIRFVPIACLVLFGFTYLMMEQRQHMSWQRLFRSFGRSEYWQEAINMIKDYPLLGVGLNAYSQVGSVYKINWGGYPHNCYLQMAAEIGIVGACCLVSFFVRLITKAVKMIKRMPSSADRSIVLGLTAGLTGFLLASAVDTFFYSTQLSVLMWTAMGYILATVSSQASN